MKPGLFPFSDFVPVWWNNFCSKNASFRWFPVVPNVFGSFVLKCLMKPSLFPFSDFVPVWWNKYFLVQKCIFKMVPCRSQCLWLLYVNIIYRMEPRRFPFLDFMPALWYKPFLEQKINDFQMVPCGSCCCCFVLFL